MGLNVITLHNNDANNVLDMMIEEDIKVDLIVTDPPYRTTSRGTSGGTGGMLKDKINMSGYVFNRNKIKFSEWLPRCYKVLKDNSHAYFMTNNKNLKSMLIEVEKAGFKVFKTLVWAKNNCITNMYYMDSHEYIIFARKGKAKKINNCGTRSVFNIDNPRQKVHPTEKPVELMEILIKNSSVENDFILDPFMGGGTTGIACKKLNRNFIGVELEMEYFNHAEIQINNTLVNMSEVK